MSSTVSDSTGGWMRVEKGQQQKVRVIFGGRLDCESTSALWRKLASGPVRKKAKELVVDASEVDYCDGAGIGLLIWLRRNQEKKKCHFSIEGLGEEFAHLMMMQDPGYIEVEKVRVGFLRRVVENVGRGAAQLWRDLCEQIAFLGELVAAFFSVLVRPWRMRWKDTLVIAETAGANAFGIISLVGFLFGLILAFQAAMAMRQFGVEIYAADLVALSLFRVMGPFLTAVILAARSGSAFAAELGTMKVNEEIDALTTMGLDPVRFLVVGRVLAGVLVTPLLVVFCNLFGLIGAGLVMKSLGFPLVTYVNEILSAIDLADFVGGLVKAGVFGLLVASVGCLRGLQTGAGSRAVGHAATRAVVSGIVLIIIAEGLFAVLFYVLDI